MKNNHFIFKELCNLPMHSFKIPAGSKIILHSFLSFIQKFIDRCFLLLLCTLKISSVSFILKLKKFSTGENSKRDSVLFYFVILFVNRNME